MTMSSALYRQVEKRDVQNVHFAVEEHHKLFCKYAYGIGMVKSGKAPCSVANRHRTYIWLFRKLQKSHSFCPDFFLFFGFLRFAKKPFFLMFIFSSPGCSSPKIPFVLCTVFTHATLVHWQAWILIEVPAKI